MYIYKYTHNVLLCIYYVYILFLYTIIISIYISVYVYIYIYYMYVWSIPLVCVCVFPVCSSKLNAVQDFIHGAGRASRTNLEMADQGCQNSMFRKVNSS